MAKNETGTIEINADEVLSKSKKLEDRTNVTYRIKSDTLKKFKKKCEEKGTTMSSVVEILIEEFLKGLK